MPSRFVRQYRMLPRLNTVSNRSRRCAWMRPSVTIPPRSLLANDTYSRIDTACSRFMVLNVSPYRCLNKSAPLPRFFCSFTTGVKSLLFSHLLAAENTSTRFQPKNCSCTIDGISQHAHIGDDKTQNKLK